jgi:tripartite-type tricarboxylate transporter receptor subunit TctC
LMAELLQVHAGIKLSHVPYKGAGPAITDTVAGQINATFTTPATAAAHLKSGRLRALAVTSDERLSDYPDVPTLAESGIPNMSIRHWWAVLAPAGLALTAPDVRERFAAAGVRAPPAGGAETLRALIASDLARWRTIVASAGVTAE